ncbi:MAG: GNAT family N-acetyltransferase [Candidatus Bathyarchaeia archaeon]
MEIRELTIDHYEELINLWRRAGLPFKPKGRDSKEAIARQISANPEFFLGAFENGRLIGAVILSSDGRKGWINRLAVDPSFRRQGIASALVSEAERVFLKHDIKIFCALIEDENEASKRLFRKCGYVEHRDIIYFSKRESDDV